MLGLVCWMEQMSYRQFSPPVFNLDPEREEEKQVVKRTGLDSFTLVCLLQAGLTTLISSVHV